MDNRTRAHRWIVDFQKRLAARVGVVIPLADVGSVDVVEEANLTAAFDSVQREALADAADRVAAAMQGVPMCGQTGCAEVAACDVRRVEAEIRALATPTKPGDETK